MIDFKNMEKTKQKNIIFIAGVIVLALLVPFVFQDSYTRHLFILAFIYAMIAANWDLSLGYTGILNFGHLALFGVGVYSAGIACKVFGINPWLSLPIAGVVTSFFALILSAPVVRLTGIYVVLVSFAFGQVIVQLVLSQPDITGGSNGLVRLPFLKLGDYNFLRDKKMAYYYLALCLLLINLYALHRMANSNFGRSLKAIRDNEDYAQSRGISIARQRILVLVMTSFFVGIVGGFYAIYFRVASVDVFSFALSAFVLSILLIGGINSIFGSVLAAFFITFASEKLAEIPNMDNFRFVITSLAMIVILRIAPGGMKEIFLKYYNKYYLKTHK